MGANEPLSIRAFKAVKWVQMRRISSVGKSLGMKLAHKGLGVGKVSAEAQTLLELLR